MDCVHCYKSAYTTSFYGSVADGLVFANDARFAECTFCRVAVCTSCVSLHPESHRIAAMHMRVQRGHAGADKDRCSHCGRLVLDRRVCRQCPYVSCSGCWAELGISAHEHNLFVTVTTCASAGRQQCNCLKQPAPHHCHGCAVGKMTGPSILKALLTAMRHTNVCSESSML